MSVRRRISVVAAVLAAGSAGVMSAAPAQAAVFERGFPGISIFEHTCNPRPNNTVWVEIRGHAAGNDNYVSEVRYKNFSSYRILIHRVVVGANGQYVYPPTRELSPFSEVVYPVNRTFPGKMTVVNDMVAPEAAGENCGGKGGNLHAFSRP